MFTMSIRRRCHARRERFAEGCSWDLSLIRPICWCYVPEQVWMRKRVFGMRAVVLAVVVVRIGIALVHTARTGWEREKGDKRQ